MFMESINFTSFTVEHGAEILGQQGSTVKVWEGSSSPGIRVYIQVPPLVSQQLGRSSSLQQISVALAFCQY